MKAFEEAVNHPLLRSSKLPKFTLDMVKDKYISAKKRLFCLDYDGTLGIYIKYSHFSAFNKTSISCNSISNSN